MPELDRRSLLVTGAVLGASALPGAALAQAAPPPSRTFTPQPLPFDPKAITGLSEKLLTS